MIWKLGDINIQCILYILYIESYMSTWVCIWGLQRVNNIFLSGQKRDFVTEGIYVQGVRWNLTLSIYQVSLSFFCSPHVCSSHSFCPEAVLMLNLGVQSPRESHTTLSFICVSCTDAYPPVLSLTEDTSKTWLLNIRDKKPEKDWESLLIQYFVIIECPGNVYCEIVLVRPITCVSPCNEFITCVTPKNICTLYIYIYIEYLCIYIIQNV